MSAVAHQKGSDFTTLASAALGDLCGAVGAILNRLGLAGQTPTEVASSLSLNMNLAWKITRLVEQPDPLGTVAFLPGAAAFETFLRAAAARGVDGSLVDRARSAMRRVETVIDEHAGDRESMEVMIAEIAEPNGGRVALAQRKAAFQGNSAILGIQARAIHRIAVYAPSSDPDRLDFAAIRSVFGLRWLRATARWTIGTTTMAVDGARVDEVLRSQPLEPPARPGDPPLISRFCSSPLPRCERTIVSGNITLDQIVCPDVGSRSAVTCVLGESLRGVLHRYRTSEDHLNGHGLTLTVPCEVGVMDVFMHRSLFPGTPPEMGVHTHLVAGHFPLGRPASRLPIVVPVEHLGMGAAAARPRDVPRCEEMAAFAFERMGWDSSEFELYRVRVEYPPIASDIVMHWNLPERPTTA